MYHQLKGGGMEIIMKKYYIIKTLLILFLVLISNKEIYANQHINSVQSNQEELDNKMKINEYVLTFGKFITKNENIDIKNITKIYNKKGLNGYCYDFNYNGKNYGYAVYTFTKNDITTFSIEEDENGLYDKIIRKFPMEYEKTNVLYEDDNFNFYAIIKKDKKNIAINVNGEIVPDNKTVDIYNSTIVNYSYDDIFNISGDIPDNIAYTHYLKTENYLKMPARYGEQYITNCLKCPYSCAVTAMLNVCANNKFFNVTTESNRKKAYEELFILSGTKYDKNLNEYLTDQTRMGYSVAMFARNNKGVSLNYTRKNNPSVNFFTSAINKGYSSILGITTSCRNGNKVGIAGHAYSVIGYKHFAPCYSNGKSKIYLKVATGWGDLGDTEYILYNNINVISKYGVVWEYKPK